MRKLISILTLVVCLGVSMQSNAQASCNDRPIVNDFTPKTGFIGSTVTISGANFSPTPAENQVFFGATEATIISSSFGTLEVRVPEGSTTALISVKNQCELSAYSKTHFNGIFCPTPLTTTTYQNVAQQINSVGAYNMISQDMDNDGLPEVISSGSGLTIAQNNSIPGTINFNPINISTSFNRSIASADFDGDGLKDLVSDQAVYRNTSTGPGNINVVNAGNSRSVSSYQIGVGDFNNDGKIDIIGQNGAGVYVAFNTSTGPGNFSFTNRQFIQNLSGGRCNGIQVADVDGDGKADFLASLQQDKAASLRNTTPDGSFVASFEAAEYWASNGSYPYRAMIADFNKDGKIDFTSCNFRNSGSLIANVAIWINTSTVGDISFAPTINLPSPNANYRIGVGDVDGDGYADVVTKSSGSNVFSVYKNTSTGIGGTPTFGTRIDYTSSTRAEASGIVVGDFDGDFVPDIATSGTASRTIRFHRNTSAQVDQDPPTAVCKNIIVALNPDGTVTITPEKVDNGSSDACGLDNIALSQTEFTCNDIGENTVTLTVTDVAGNQTSCQAIVNVQPAAIIVAGQTTVCQGETIPMTANDGDSYQWFNAGVAISGSTSQTYTATATGSYTVTVTNAGGCSGESLATNVVVNENPTVDVTPGGTAYICPNGTATLTASQSAIYQWMQNGVDIPNATQQVYNATLTGNYSVRVIDLFGCSAESNTVVVATNPPEIDVTGNGNYGNVFPNQNYTQTITISNTGTNNLDIENLSVSGPDAGFFTLSGFSSPGAVAPGTSVEVDVTFNGSDLTVYSAVLTFDTNDCDEPSFTIPLDAEITCPEITADVTPYGLDCFGYNYQLTIVPNGGAEPYTVTATGGTPSTSEPNVFLFNGFTSPTNTVTISVTDANGCILSPFDYELTNPTLVVAGSVEVVDATCASTNDGSVTYIGISGGTPHENDPEFPTGYSYELFGPEGISPSQGSPTFSDLLPGNYGIAVNDASGCGGESFVQFQIGFVDNEAPVIACQNITIPLDENGTASIVAEDLTALGNLTSENWIGFIGLFENDDFVGGNVVAIADIKSTIDAGNNRITLQPNFDSSHSSNSTLQGSTYIETFGTLGGNPFEFTGEVVSNTLDSNYDGFAFIRIFDNSFGFIGEISSPLVPGTDFSVEYDNSIPEAFVIQYGFTVEGPPGAHQDEDALGNAVVQGMRLKIPPYDNCGIASIEASQTNFDCSQLGENMVTLTVTDVNGNVSTCDAIVTVVDKEEPIITCPTDITACATSEAGAVLTYVTPVVTDNCGGVTPVLVTGLESGSVFPIGTTTIRYEATDAGNNTVECEFTVTVNPIPNVDPIDDIVVCNGEEISDIIFEGNVTDGQFTWTNDDTSIGLAASGSGNISGFTAMNTTNAPITATITVTPLSPDYLYVSTVGDNSVSVINTLTNSIVATIPVGSQPYGTSASVDGTKVYITNRNDNSVSVIDTATNAVEATVDVGGRPSGILASPDGTRVYVGVNNFGSGGSGLAVIDTFDNSVTAPLLTGNIAPWGTAVSPDGTRLYATVGSSVSVIDTADYSEIANLTVGSSLFRYAISPDGSRLYVTDISDNTLRVIDTATNTLVTTLTFGDSPNAITINPDGSKVYVSIFGGTTVEVINTADNTVTASIEVGANQGGISVSSDGSFVYLARQSNSSVTVINTATNSVETDIAVNSHTISYGNFVASSTYCAVEPRTFTITVNPSPVVTIAQSELPEFCQGAVLQLTASSDLAVSYSWAGSDETSNVLDVSADGVYTVTVTSAEGCTTTEAFEVSDFDAEALLSSYTLLATDEIHLHGNNTVSNGALGVLDNDGDDKDEGDIKIHDETVVAGFAKAADIDVHDDSSVGSEVLAPADVELPTFYYNMVSDNDSEDITVEEGETVTLSGDVYGKVDVKEGGTLIFTNSNIFLEELKTKEEASVSFLGSTNLYVNKKVDIDKDNIFNGTGDYTVVIYAEYDVEVKEGSNVTANIYSKKDIEAKGKDDNLTTMTGLFIAKKIKGNDYVNWGAGTSCSPTEIVVPEIAPDCECKGGITALTFEYSGGGILTTNSGSITNNADGTYTVTNDGEKLEKNFEIFDGTNLAVIHTSCSQDILGVTFEDVTVLGYTDNYGNMSSVAGCTPAPEEEEDCECNGGITALTFSYEGTYSNLSTNSGIITDNGDGTYTITNEGEKIEKNLKITNGSYTAEIHTSCSQDILGVTFSEGVTVVGYTDNYGNSCSVDSSVARGATPTSLKISSVFDVEAYPIPSDDMFSIRLQTQNRTDRVELQVFDLNNRQLYKDTFRWNAQFKFGRDLPSGMYYVTITQGKHIKVLRVVKY